MATSGQVTSYDYQIHGGANGYAGNRAIIRLYGAQGTLAYVHVIPTGNPIPGDTDLAWTRITRWRALATVCAKPLMPRQRLRCWPSAAYRTWR